MTGPSGRPGSPGAGLGGGMGSPGSGRGISNRTSLMTKLYPRFVFFAAFACTLAACARPSEPGPPPSASPAALSAQTHSAATVAPADFGALKWRHIGPAVMGGRLDAVAGVPGDARTIYLGHSSGGLYKSTNGGMSFAPVFSAGRSTSIGALAVAPSNPNILYAGTGEGFPRNTAALGDGVFRSTDAGKTWHIAGLRDSQHIAKIAVDPNNPDIALVAAMGPEWTAGGTRGIYRTTDGGAHWTRVLWVNPTTGGSDVVFDPANPAIAYAGTFDYLREPWHFRGGGPGSGLYRSTDNGATWTRLTDAPLHNGLPSGTINRVGIGVSFHHPNVVYAIVPAKNAMLFRSDDRGAHWRSVNAKEDLVFRPFYFSQVRVDPENPDDVWVLSGAVEHSTDGGKTFKNVDAGGDNHDLWIDPRNRSRMLLGSDMGLHITVDGGATWEYDNVVPLSQVYRVGFDRALPYHIMGGMQDHEVWWGPNTLWNDSGVTGGSWRNISDWGDGQNAIADPRDPDIVYENTHFGDVTRRNLRTGEARYISPQPKITFGTGAGSFRYRFNWSSPLYLSPHDPNVLYYGGNVLFKSADGGTTWSVASSDLSQPCDASKLAVSGGPLTHDNTNAEAYCTIYALAEDAGDAATLWAGTDNGHVAITRDGGTTWSDVTANLPGHPDGWIASIEASHVDAGVAYVTVDRHRYGDTRAYVFATVDYGKTWRTISNGLPLYAYVVREDPRAKSLLFAGTEDGIYASFDRGGHWSDLRLGMEHVPVYDLQLQPDANDLILGTHGRGFYVLDDMTPLEHLAEAVKGATALFAPMPAYRYVTRPSHDIGHNEFVADNKPYGISIAYYLKPLPKPTHAKKKPKKERVELRVLDANHHLVRTLEATANAGINRVVWDFTSDPPGGPKAPQDKRDSYVFYSVHIDGPEVLPGRYWAELKARNSTLTVPLEVRIDPSVDAHADLRAQYDALRRLAQIQAQAEKDLASVLSLHKQIDRDLAHTKDRALDDALNAYRRESGTYADALRNGDGSQNAGYKHPAQLIDQIAYLRHLIETSLDAPTAAQQAAIDDYAHDGARLHAESKTLFGQRLDRLNALLREKKRPPLHP